MGFLQKSLGNKYKTYEDMVNNHYEILFQSISVKFVGPLVSHKKIGKHFHLKYYGPYIANFATGELTIRTCVRLTLKFPLIVTFFCNYIIFTFYTYFLIY